MTGVTAKPKSKVESGKSRWFFSDADAVQRLCNAAAQLEGTPFRKFSDAPGRTGGIDCIGAARYLMREAGAIRDFDFPRTDADYENHAFGDRFLTYMRGEALVMSSEGETPTKHGKLEDSSTSVGMTEGAVDPASAYLHERFAEIETPDLREANPRAGAVMPGDLIVLQHQQLVHLPIVLNDELPFEIISALPRLGVRIGTLQDTTFRQHFKALFRARAL